jgi:ribonuclease R
VSDPAEAPGAESVSPEGADAEIAPTVAPRRAPRKRKAAASPEAVETTPPLETAPTEPPAIIPEAEAALELVNPEPSAPESAPLEPVPLEPLEQKVVKTRRRKIVVEDSEPAAPVVRARARGRKASTEAPLFDAQTPDPEPPEVLTSSAENEPADAPNGAATEPEAAPAAKPRLVRTRKTARENVFETQAKIANPLEALLEHLRVNPGGQALRDLENDLSDVLLMRLGGRKGLEDALETLVDLGAALQLKRHTYAAAREPGATIVGRLRLRPDGWGVVTPDTPGLREMLIPSGALLYAWDRDRVVVRETKKNGESYGAIIRVLERCLTQLVGTVGYARGALVVHPDGSHQPVVPLEPAPDATPGARVVVRVQYPEMTGEDDAYATLERVLGATDTLESERLAVRVRCGLPGEFSAEALKEAQKEASIGIKDLQGRVDLRAKRVTAARVSAHGPLEVGVQAEGLGNGNVLIGVHVVDAAHFVAEGKALDAAALERARRVDLAGEALGLLPEILERAAAFKIGADRLAISVLVEASPDGNVVNYIVRHSVVNAKAMLEDGLEPAERALMERLAVGLRSARGMNASDASPGVILEELLLLANRLGAATLAAHDAPALYRRAPQRSQDFEAALERALGASPAMIAALETAHTRLGELTVRVAPDMNTALEFTAPLSSYADLVNARILGHCLVKLSARRRELLEENLPAVAQRLNATEPRVRGAQEQLEQYRLRAPLGAGTPVKGIVLQIDPWGIDFALENGACARLDLPDMDDEYTYSEPPKMLKARSGRVFRTGSIARLTVLEARRTPRLGLGKTPGAPLRATNGFKENEMAKKKRPQSGASETPRRQVVVLHAKPRGEHQRGVRVTARKLYFGEWSRAAFVASDEFGGEISVDRPPPQQQRAQNNSRPAQPNRNNNPSGGNRQGQRPNGAVHQQNRPAQNLPASKAAPQGGPQPSRASRIEEVKRRSEQTLERNAERAMRGPLEGSTPQRPAQRPAQRNNQPRPEASSAATPEASSQVASSQAAPAPREGGAHRRRRRGRGGNKPAAS